jgi:nucleoside-diphosphate-sugar epimerase
MDLAGKTVLVTGGTGFVGGRLVEKLILEQKANVRVLVRSFLNASRLARFPIEMVGGDITDRTAVSRAVEGSDFVFHCAHDAKSNKDPQMQSALEGIHNISESVLRAEVKQMIHVSTVAVYGPTSDGELDETSPWQPSDHSYISAKREAERLVLQFHEQKSLPVVVLQPTVVYGPYCRPWTLRPINDLKTGLVPLVNGGSGYCNAVYIDDVVDAMILAATQPNAIGETFLISANEPVTWKVFYNAFETALGIRSTIEISEEQLLEMRQNKNKSTWKKLISLGEKSPPMRVTRHILKSLLSEERRKALKSLLSPNTSDMTKQDEHSKSKSIHVPDETLLSFYRARTVVRIEKARESLGYNPKFGFGRGMNLTTQFIHWANLG